MIDYIYTNSPIDEAAVRASKIIKQHLENNEKVLWLLSGGSSLTIATKAGNLLKDLNLSNLFISLTDERYGPIGHPDENYKQLLGSGFSLNGAYIYRPLNGKSISETTADFIDWLKDKLDICDYKIGIFGFGTDGHTAGIKPNSVAVQSSNLAEYFIGNDFRRITITFETIKQLDEAIIQASGVDKKPIINDLMTKNLSIEIQPAKILKTIPIATLYTNNKEI
jgi:6-phosphogluconolactonase/glucosamine-6-phosphate isomerase/deaminase